MAVSLYAVNEGYIDDVDAIKVVDFEAALHAHVNENFGELVSKINESGDLNDEIEAGLKEAVEDFKRNGAY
jgi:F-type H+-transporting ATPase subunit alpha